VACAYKNVSDQQRAVCHDLLKAAGVVEWVSDESLIDAVTAVSGSGPAYVFHMVEALAGAGEQIGLSPDLARKLALHTVSGAGALLEQSDQDATTLRTNVTSPNGTTEAALNILMGQDGLGQLMLAAVRAAHKRSKELAD
jgi:pyrroline-5-carboxylate reductase